MPEFGVGLEDQLKRNDYSIKGFKIRLAGRKNKFRLGIKKPT